MTMHTCLYCLKRLPANDVVEAFPFGRQVAYDPAKDRLWVVCHRCRRWSMAPLSEDERGTSIDLLERWWRSTSAHYSTGGIGLGQFSERFSIVRIGDATWNEFASWRYARNLTRRRMRHFGSSAASAVAIGVWMGLTGAVNLPAALGMFGGFWALDHYRWWHRLSTKAMCRIPAAKGRAPVREKHIISMELVRQRTSWSLNTKHDSGVTTLTEGEAVRALSYALPRLNHRGASQRNIKQAMSLIADAGGPEGMTHRTAEPIEKGSRSYSETALLLKQPELKLLALEIATQEQNERRLMENELALLRAEWQEAEEIATTVDTMDWPGGRT